MAHKIKRKSRKKATTKTKVATCKQLLASIIEDVVGSHTIKNSFELYMYISKIAAIGISRLAGSIDDTISTNPDHWLVIYPQDRLRSLLKAINEHAEQTGEKSDLIISKLIAQLDPAAHAFLPN